VELLKPLSPIIQVFLLIAAGFVFAHWKKISLTSVTEIIVYLGTPLWCSAPSPADHFLPATSSFCSPAYNLSSQESAYSYDCIFFVFRFSSRGFALPCLFMNAGNIGFRLALFTFGEAGMQRATLMFVMLTLLQYSLGIYILNGRGNRAEIFRLPLIYAAMVVLAVNLAQVIIPELLLQPITTLGQATISIMLISLGYRLHAVESLQLGHAFGGALLRIFGGFAQQISP
jgi:predicted permease